MSAFNNIIERARTKCRRIVLPEASDPRVLKAAVRISAEGLATPVLLGEPDVMAADLQRLGLSAKGLELHDRTDADTNKHFTELLMQLGKKRGMTRERAEQAMQMNVSYGCLMVRTGEAEGCVAGAITATADVVRSARRAIEQKADAPIVSSFFIMLLDAEHPLANSVGEAFLTADCALVIEPDETQLAAIATATGDTAETLLGMDPQVAMLSFSTAQSAQHARVQKVVNATAMARAARPSRRIMGDVQLDAAVMPDILAAKAPDESPGPAANVLIFPDLDAGNIGYKLIQRFAGAQAIGPILQGLSRPVNDLSRGCSVDDIVNIVTVTAAQVED